MRAPRTHASAVRRGGAQRVRPGVAGAVTVQRGLRRRSAHARVGKGGALRPGRTLYSAPLRLRCRPADRVSRPTARARVPVCGHAPCRWGGVSFPSHHRTALGVHCPEVWVGWGSFPGAIT